MFGGDSSINIQLTARQRRRWWNFALWRRLRQLRPLSTVLNMAPIISWRYSHIRICVHTRMHTRMYKQRGIHACMRHARMLRACICIHTNRFVVECIRAYENAFTYIHVGRHACYMRACAQATDLSTYIHTYKHTNIHIYIHTYTLTYIHTYICVVE